MTIKYLKKASKTASTDDTKTKDIVQNLLKELETTDQRLLYYQRPKKF